VGSDWGELYKDPRWQKKRLEVMEGSGFRCERCGRDDLTLHVHHTYYETGYMPWEYPDSSLYVLCENCHELADELRNAVKVAVGQLLPVSGFQEVLGYIDGVAMRTGKRFAVQISSAPYAAGVAGAFGLVASHVLEAAQAHPDEPKDMVCRDDFMSSSRVVATEATENRCDADLGRAVALLLRLVETMRNDGDPDSEHIADVLSVVAQVRDERAMVE